jgi:catechol 2,3-dioxygenase-like lactoylglutathione lyase family enzyme
MIVQDLAAGTVTVSGERLDDVIGVYADTFGWSVRWSGQLGDALARAWGIDNPSRRVVVVGPAGERRGLIRLVEGETPPPPPLGTDGWSSLEITVRDCDGLHERLVKSPHFRVNGEPHDLKFSDAPPGQRAMQAVGPAGEQLYLTQILRQTPGRELVVPPDGADVGGMFIAVLCTHDYPAARAFYVDVLGYDCYIESEVSLSAATREMGVSPETRYQLAAFKPLGETRIELDGYPANVGAARSVRPGELPPGFGLASLYVTDFDAALAAVRAAGARVLGDPQSHEPPPYDGQRAIVVVGGAGELVELIGR